MSASREPIMVALKAALKKIPEFNTVTRRLRTDSDFNAPDFPVLMIDELSEGHVRSGEMPDKTTVNVELLVFMRNGSDPDGEPISVLNNLLDKIDGALAPGPYETVFTLGGLVSHCWIEGTIEKGAGDLNGVGGARIPLKILIS